MKNCDVMCNEFDISVSFSIMVSPTKLGIAELSFMEDEDMWYFSRLNVPLMFRGMGYGRELLKSVLEWCEKKKACIFLEINNHAGAGFDLVPMYEKYGFVNNGDFWIYDMRDR